MGTQDRQLVRQLLAGDERAFGRFFDDYFSRLYRFALVRLSDDPEAAREVAHSTLSKGLRKLATYRAEAALFTWLCAICRNEVSDWLRRQARHRDHLVLVEDRAEVAAAIDSFAAPAALQPDKQFQRVESLRLIQVALDRLPAKYGDVLEWKYIDGATTKEIAARLAIGQEAAQSTIARAKRAFADVYGSLHRAVDEQQHGVCET